MEIITTATGWELLIRFVHLLAGVTWVGLLYYLSFIQPRFLSGELGAPARSPVLRGLLPDAMWWVRWAAMFSFLSGWTIVLMKLGYARASLDMGYMTRILTGAAVGTLMWANVWFLVWPAQRVVVRSAERVAAGGEAIREAAARADRAAVASRVNALLSIPVLFFMASASHLPSFSAGPSALLYWLIAGVLLLAVETPALIAAGSPIHKPLASIPGTVYAGVGLTLLLYLLGTLLND
jgi:uncharacterized membrane protein